MVTALVSGGNRGVGYGIVRKLAADFPTSSVYGSSSEALTIYLGSRDTSKGEEARTAILKEAGSLDRVNIEVRQMDISSHESLAALAKEFKSGLDILINNAGIAMDGFDGNVAKKTVATNYFAVQDAINTIPVKDGGRIVNVASIAGLLKGYGDDITKRFLNAKSTQQVDELMNEFVSAVADGSYKDKGWKGAAYSASKCGLIAYTRALAEEYERQGKKTVVNAVCPGCKCSQL